MLHVYFVLLFTTYMYASDDVYILHINYMAFP